METVVKTSGLGTRIFFNAALKLGLSLEAIERESGIFLAELDKPDTRIPIDRVRKLWEMVSAASKDPALGLHLVERYRPYPFHFITHIILNSETVMEGFRHWADYARIEVDTNRVDLRKEGNHVVVRYTNASDYQAIWIPEYYLSQAITNCRLFVSNDIAPVEARFAHPIPEYAGEYGKLFRSPVYFSQDENALVFRRKDTQRRILSPNPYLKAVLKRQADNMLVKMARQADICARIEDLIVMHLSERRVNIRWAAHAMNMAPSTLKRRLKDEKTTFSLLVNQTRKRLSTGYIKQGFPLKEVSRLLGFSDPSAFQHAFKRWFGRSPGKYRADMA